MKKAFLILFSILIISNSIYGQIISGSVKLANYDSPGIGVNVVVKGTMIGTVTDINGNYKIEVDSIHKTLCFSQVGQESVEVDINNKNIIDVSLEDATIGLEDFIITSFIKRKPTYTSAYYLNEPCLDTIIKNNDDHKMQIIRIEKKWGNADMYHDWQKYLYESINYPKESIKNYTEGNVFAKFLIDTIGYIQNIEIVRSDDSLLCKEVYNALFLMPKWDLIKYRYIRCKKYFGIFILPIKFRLTEN